MPNKPLQPTARSAGPTAGARPRLMSRIKERPGFLSRCLPSFPFHAPPSDNAGVQSNRVVVRPQAWQRSSRSCGSWPAATRRLDPHPKDRVVHYVHYVQKAQGGSELPVRVVGSRHLTSSSRSQGARSCSHGVLRCRTCGLRSSSLSSPGRRRHVKAQGCGDLQQGNRGDEHAYGPQPEE